jgi:predicted protein tyrosine phosphatase
MPGSKIRTLARIRPDGQGILAKCPEGISRLTATTLAGTATAFPSASAC